MDSIELKVTVNERVYREPTYPYDPINGVDEDYKDIHLSLILNGIDSSHIIDGYYLAKSAFTGEYWIATCGCGNAGCAGIDAGIKVKVRKHTVEWRIPRNDGYSFDKTFYSFKKSDYLAMLDGFVQQLKDIVEEDWMVYDQFSHSQSIWDLIATKLKNNTYDRTIPKPIYYW